MTLQLSSEQVWHALGKEVFAILGMVTAKGEARTVGIMYAARDHKLYIPSGADAWKVRHVAANPHVSMTIPIAKRVPGLWWVKIPAATITFSGLARVYPAAEASPEILHAVFRTMADEKNLITESCLIEVTPVGDFITYGVGVSLTAMRHPHQATGRAPV